MNYLLEALKQRCKAENNWYLNRPLKWFYTFKFAVCYVLEWQPPKSVERHPTTILVAATDYHKGYSWEFGVTAHNWTEWRVGYGLLKQWWYYETSDGTP